MLKFYDLNLNTKDPVYLQIALYVKRKILVKEISLGDKLPSRREIATQLNVNPNTVQKAFKVMEDEGYVHTSGNQGSIIFVNDEIFNRIEKQLTHELVKEFITSVKGVDLSFKKTIDLVSNLWDEEDEE